MKDPEKRWVEPLTDSEKRLFLAAIAREMEICKEIDRETCREAYEDSLEYSSREIRRKVRAALWREHE